LNLLPGKPRSSPVSTRDAAIAKSPKISKIAEKTVRIHVSAVLDKMGASDRTQATIYALHAVLGIWNRESFGKNAAGATRFFWGYFGKNRSFLMVFGWSKRGELWCKRGRIRGRYVGLRTTPAVSSIFLGYRFIAYGRLGLCGPYRTFDL
jgi:hypothetical protein